MVGGRMGGFWTSCALLAVVSAGPLHRYPRESEDYQNDLSIYANYTANEVCFSEGEVFQKGDMMPNPGPCEECRCEPPSIVCNMVKCPTNHNGCRTIQRANHCCPDYNCVCDYNGQLYNDGERLELPEEPCQVCYCKGVAKMLCDYNGQLYNDGERLELPEEPCQVCYCKGGEVMCNSITCYHRDDCDPIQVPGQCCPKYENCPVRDMGSSGSDEKNVLVRSTNKTNHVSPKREMNPWLLTKVPPVSSMSPPKTSQDPTTEGANIIVVSDWLSERRTTTEDATSSDDESQDHSTDEPDVFTYLTHLTTSLNQELSSDGATIVNTSDVITPVDEVIFTRIDGPKLNQEVNLGETTSISSKGTRNQSTNGISVGVVESQSNENTTDINITETPLDLTIVKDDFKELNSSTDISVKQVLPDAPPMETTVHSQKPTKPSVQIKETDTNFNSTIITDTPLDPSTLNNNLEANTTTTGLSSTPIYDLTGEAKTRDVQKGIILENLFGVDELSLGDIEQETTTQDPEDSYTTETEEVATRINEFTGNSLEDQTNDEVKVGKLKISLNDVKTTLDTSTNMFTDSAVTTPFFVEVNLKEYNIGKRDNMSKEISENNATELPIIKKEDFSNTNRSESEDLPLSDQKVSSTTENALPSTTDTTKVINNLPNPIEIKIKRNDFNSSVDQRSPVQSTVGSILINNSSAFPTPTILEQNTHPQNESSNNSMSAKMNVDPPISVNTDDTSPILVIIGDDSDDSKELISDAPPVLELNSHVPFLQLGGHGNIDAVMNTFGENLQTTIANENGSIDSEKETGGIDKDFILNLSPNSSDANSSLKKESDSLETIPSPEVNTDGNNNQSTNQEIKIAEKENEGVVTESSTEMILTTPHIPLTPGDLKVLAEYLINDTIKPVPAENVSNYVPNKWLKGNLTEEKLSSILSAANVSIAIMNKTDDKAKSFIVGTTAKVGEASRFDKLEKDKLSSGKNTLNNVKKGNKTGFIRGKTDDYLDSPKINYEPEKPQNDEAKTFTTVKINTESPNNVRRFSVRNTTTDIKEISPAKHQMNKPLNYTQSPSLPPQSKNIQSVSENPTQSNLRFDNSNPAETNQNAQRDLIRNTILPVNITTSVTSASTATTSDPRKLATP